MAQKTLTTEEILQLQEALNSDWKTVDIRLRKGEYQYSLAQVIASCQLELKLLDVRDIIERLFGENKVNDTKLIRKIQTILKKMEKSGVITILKKRRPWDLQTYALTSFKFIDAEKNNIFFATVQDIDRARARTLLKAIPNNNTLSNQEGMIPKTYSRNIRLLVFIFLVSLSYSSILWNLTQQSINPVMFIITLSVAMVFSIVLGRTLSQEKD